MQARSVEAIIAAYAKTHAKELRLTDDRLNGPAADWFRAEAAKAQFLFIGEEHDVREIPLILGALWHDLVPLGFKHVALEAGPWLGGRLDRFARFSDRAALDQFRKATWPRLPNNSVPPNSVEDIRFYELLGRVSAPHKPGSAPLIWGLTSEYRATPLLKRLMQLTPASLSRNQIEPLLQRMETAEAAGDYNTRKFRNEIKDLIRTVPARPGTEISQIVDGLNWRIMEPGERERGSMMPEIFWRRYQAAKQQGDPSPRVMLRFGGYHAARGLMLDMGGSTLANFVATLAVMERSRMLNVVFKNCQGTTPGAFPRPCTWEEDQSLRPFRAAAAGAWTLFDLRALRESLQRARLSALQSYPEGWQFWNLVMGYDALVLLNESSQSRLPDK